MGSFLISSKVDPNQSKQNRLQSSSLFNCRQEVSRANFKFIRKISASGVNEQVQLWLASNVHNSSQTFFIKQYDKIKVYNHKRVAAVLHEMKLLTESTNPYFIRTYFAFQDYESLYLVTEAIDSIEFSEIIGKRFTEEEAKYVIFALISIIEELHKKGFAFTELCPKNLHINKQTGEMKLLEIINPVKIDSYCNSCVISKVSPYSAPEILLRDKVYAECDFYSLGIIIYEMMTQDIAFPMKDKKSYDRVWLLGENIEVEKSKIPEEWHSDSADFLIKLLIKNPMLRLGRYGSFEVKNHAWLKYSSEQYNVRKGIDLKEYENVIKPKIEQVQQQQQGQEKMQVIGNYFFQQLFEGYKYQYRKEQTQNVIEKQSSDDKTSLMFIESKFRIDEGI